MIIYKLKIEPISSLIQNKGYAMKFLLLALIMPLASINASHLKVYQDKAYYEYEPKEAFLGFNQKVTAYCEGQPINIEPIIECPKQKRLCKLLGTLNEAELKLQTNIQTSKLLQRLTTLPRPSTIDAKQLISTSQIIAQKESQLIQEKESLTQKRNKIKQKFFKQAPTKEALQTDSLCQKQISLTLPYGFVSFSTAYEATLVDNEISVKQYLSILNRSGIDIEAKRADFYYTQAVQPLSPIAFNPWIVSEYKPSSKRNLKKDVEAKYLRVQPQRVSLHAHSIAQTPLVSYQRAREYHIENITLPSTGTPLRLPILSWKAPINCEIKTYPYYKKKAFEVCTFEPKYPIEQNQWRVKSSTTLMNEKAQGEYIDGRYRLYTKSQEDILIERKKVVRKDDTTGIFEKTQHQKDGFTLTLTNQSQERKSLTIIERIPTSTTQAINVKLLTLSSNNEKVDYKLSDDGKIEIKLSLKSNEVRKIVFEFEISYGKDIEIKY